MKAGILLFIALLPSIAAWNWETHTALVDSVYYALDEGLREKLNLTEMEEGSVAPDKVFKDFRNHGFPRSLEEARAWKHKTEAFLAAGEYDHASYAFGVMSHYVSDSFSAPHTIAGEQYKLHQQYEQQGNNAYLPVKCVKERVALEDVCYTGSLQGKTWGAWVETRDERLPQAAVGDAGRYLLSLALDLFGSDCHNVRTRVEQQEWALERKDIVLACVVAAVMTVVGVSLCRDGILKK